MERIYRGVEKFRRDVFPEQREQFERLAAKKQNPYALFITCSDSRVHPNLFTQTEPGDIFLLRNAGNLVPAYGASSEGEGATIEYALAVLGIHHVVVCGHSHCGAMQGLLHPETACDLPAVSSWFKHAETTRRIVEKRHSNLTGDDLARAAAQENVLVQISNLLTHPCVASRYALGELQIHGWYYEIETGAVLEYSEDEGHFIDLSEPALPTESAQHPEGAASTGSPRNARRGRSVAVGARPRQSHRR
ncbi:MAG TPA: carbonic anhydrase [Planctomycetia bacterium]|jgi:carbonic anhydrase|nr:carbonic anhydrase [Planctomycetia bacterium]